MPQYTFKFLQETIWAVVVAALTFLSSELAAGIPVDKAAWLAVAAGLIRAVLAAIVAKLGSGGFQAS